MKALIFGLSTALVTLVPYWISEPVSATGIAQYINPFNSDGGVTVRGNASRTLTSSASIFSPLLGPVTRTIAGTKTGGSRVPALEAFVDASVNRFYFDTGIGVLGHAPIDYGTFAAKDFTVAGMADKFLLDIETLLVESRDPLSVTGLTVRFDFTDSDGTTGTLSQTFKETISNPQRFELPFSSVRNSGGNGSVDFRSIAAFSFRIEAPANAFSGTVLKPLALGGFSVTSPILPLADGTADDNFVGIVFPETPDGPPRTIINSFAPTDTPEPATLLGLLAFGAFGSASRLGARGRWYR